MIRIFLSSLLLLLGAAGASAAIQKGAVEVLEVKGEAFLIDASGNRTSLGKGVMFKEGCRVETGEGAEVHLGLSNGVTLQVLPASLVELKVFTQVSHPDATPSRARELNKEPSVSIVQVEVYRGKVTGEARGLNPSSTFTIKTPIGTTRIR